MKKAVLFLLLLSSYSPLMHASIDFYNDEVPSLVDSEIALPKNFFNPIKKFQNLLCKTSKQCLPALFPSLDQAIGYYSYREDLKMGGKLINDYEVEKSGPGFYVKTNSQENRWSTDHSVFFIRRLGNFIIQKNISPQIIVGDISVFGGGPINGHISHQNGLDIDIGLLGNQQAPAPLEQFPKDYVINNSLTEKFGVQENWIFIQEALGTEWPLFVLVHSAVKKKFCELALASGNIDKYTKILSLIIPEDSHFDHYHFRLRCPISSLRCIPRELFPEVSGC